MAGGSSCSMAIVGQQKAISGNIQTPYTVGWFIYIYTFIIYIYTCFHPAYESRSCRAYSWTTSKGLIVRTDAVVLCSGSYLC